MKQTTISSLFVIAFLIQWQNVPLVTAGVYDAVLTGMMQKDNEYFTIKKDASAKSGWAIKTKKDIKRPATDIDLFVEFFVRNDSNGEFKSVSHNDFCFLLTTDANSRNYISRELVRLMFTRKFNHITEEACNFRKDEVDNPMDKGKVHAGAGENRGSKYPKTVPYELEARIITRAQKKAKTTTDYLIKASFDIGKPQEPTQC